MRIWTLHPSHLDTKGLVALWREALLAQKVLRGATRGYRHHPQLARFRSRRDPVAAIATYLHGVATEAKRRGYNFDETKIAPSRVRGKIPATRGQIAYEWKHLLRKLRRRDPAKHRELLRVKKPAAHPLFHLVPGRVEPWEITQGRHSEAAIGSPARDSTQRSQRFSQRPRRNSPLRSSANASATSALIIPRRMGRRSERALRRTKPKS